MPIALGVETYNADAVPVVARGAAMQDSELDSALDSEVAAILRDDSGRSDVQTILAGVAETAFAIDSLNRVLAFTPPIPGWRVGEALAETFLVDHRRCEFPWPGGRDLKNPNASAAGTDLVGFQKHEQNADDCRFAFGEVKTSFDVNTPPSVVTGRHGLVKQLEELRDSTSLKDRLLQYLTLHAAGKPWLPKLRSAATKYLSDPTDIAIFGILIRDITPDARDLSSRATSLSTNCPNKTSIELRAIYLPNQTIEPAPPKPHLAQRALTALSQ